MGNANLKRADELRQYDIGTRNKVQDASASECSIVCYTIQVKVHESLLNEVQQHQQQQQQQQIHQQQQDSSANAAQQQAVATSHVGAQATGNKLQHYQDLIQHLEDRCR